MRKGSSAKPTGRMAGKDRELELKFEVPLADANKLRAHAALGGTASDTVDQVSIYFDTPKHHLFKDGYSLRVREAGGKIVQTVKAGGETAGLFDRPEWEVAVKGLEPDLRALERTPLGKSKRRLRELVEVTRSQVRRTKWLLDGDGSCIELVLDEASVSAGSEEVRFGEVEIELKQGPVERLFDLARDLAQAVPLRVSVTSKGERGYDLAAGLSGRVRKAAPVALGEEMTVAEAFSATVLACVRHFRLNEDLVLADRDPSALHQARVAMRRLRAGLSLFGPAIRDEEFAGLREEIRWFTGSLGDARNLDVFLKRFGEQLQPRNRRKVEQARARAYDTAVAAIGSQRLRDLMLDLLAWLEFGEWRGGRKAALPIRAFAGRRLDRQWAKVASGGSQLQSRDEESLHRLRIDIKKMRYAVEFLGSIYPRRQVKSFTGALEAIQETLGELNDQATARELVAMLGIELPEEAAAPRTSRKKQLGLVGRQFARLEKAGLFWKPPPD